MNFRFFHFPHRILHVFLRIFMKFCPDFATNSRKEWRVSLFQSNLRKQIRKLPKILNLSVKIIHYYASLFICVLNGAGRHRRVVRRIGRRRRRRRAVHRRVGRRRARRRRRADPGGRDEARLHAARDRRRREPDEWIEKLNWTMSTK